MSHKYIYMCVRVQMYSTRVMVEGVTVGKRSNETNVCNARVCRRTQRTGFAGVHPLSHEITRHWPVSWVQLLLTRPYFTGY